MYNSNIVIFISIIKYKIHIKELGEWATITCTYAGGAKGNINQL
jgi:hypothetical protein